MIKTVQYFLWAIKKRFHSDSTWQNSANCNIAFNHSNIYLLPVQAVEVSSVDKGQASFILSSLKAFSSSQVLLWNSWQHFCFKPSRPYKSFSHVKDETVSCVPLSVISWILWTERPKYPPTDMWNKRKATELIGCKVVVWVVFSELQLYLQITK